MTQNLQVTSLTVNLITYTEKLNNTALSKRANEDSNQCDKEFDIRQQWNEIIAGDAMNITNARFQ